MRVFKRKSRLERLRETVSDPLPDWSSPKTKRAGLIAAGGLTALTAGSAGISSLRRRLEGTGGS